MKSSRPASQTNSERPNPDALLQRVNAEAQREQRAKLKVFFGFAAGVGKTYAMLDAAQRLRVQGVDVLVGAVETHGRAETAALCKGLPLLPALSIAHGGSTLREFDLDAALARRPEVLLLDELAHSNAPGVRHAKRYQDVMDLLEAGIEVHTTLNVQHIESLNDVVAQVTEVRVRETVPDAILERADEIELIDLHPDELLTRLREGKVYLGDQAEHAARNFFQRGNLLALRELALRRTADRADAEMNAYRSAHEVRATWAAGERILVCVGPSPASASLVRAARRIAAGLRAPWLAAYVERTSLAPLQGAERQRLESHLRLAESLGATVVRLTGAKVSGALLAYARKQNVTRIILGKPTHARLRDRLRGSLLDEVVRGSEDIDVLVLSDLQRGAAARASQEPALIAPTTRRDLVWSVVAVALATGISALAREVVASADLVMIYLLMIMIVAARLGRKPSLLAAALSVAAYDFFFVAPYYTFAVSDARHVLTFAMMFAVGLLISALTLRLRHQEQSARRREERTSILYALSRELGTALDELQVATVLTRHAASLFGGGVSVLTLRDKQLQPLSSRGELPWGATETSAVSWVLEHGRSAGRGTDTLPGASVTCVPLSTGARVLGVIALIPSDANGLGFDERGFVEAFARQGALALERAQLAEDAKSAALRVRSEQMRSSLLSAVSHDLRTPLAAITGAASSLREEHVNVSPAERGELLDTLCEEAERMERLVTNLLDMTRLEAGGLPIKREWVPIEEMVGSALTRLELKLGTRRVDAHLPADLPLVPVDPALFEQVFINLFENIAKYTPPGSAIELSARVAEDAVQLELSDRGPGLPEGAEDKVFEKFFRGTHAGVGGAGLGLAICRGIVEAHGGTISAHNRVGGGALFRVTLPLSGQRAPAIEEQGAGLTERRS